eukprot:4724734-Heterocapsa_arctica.AAC.1
MASTPQSLCLDCIAYTSLLCMSLALGNKELMLSHFVEHHLIIPQFFIDRKSFTIVLGRRYGVSNKADCLSSAK